MARRNPRPSWPTRFLAGTLTPEKNRELRWVSRSPGLWYTDRDTPGRSRGHHQAGDATGTLLASTNEDAADIGQSSEGDAALLAVDDVPVTLPDGTGADGRRIGARLRLRQDEGEPLLPSHQRREPLILEVR
jgi:hypothetical protein